MLVSEWAWEGPKITSLPLTSCLLGWGSGGTLCSARGRGLAATRGCVCTRNTPCGGCALEVGSHAATPSVCCSHACPCLPPAFLNGKAICPLLCPPRLQRMLPGAQTLTFLKPELLTPRHLDLSSATLWALGIGRVVVPGCARLPRYSLTEESVLLQAVRAHGGHDTAVTRSLHSQPGSSSSAVGDISLRTGDPRASGKVTRWPPSTLNSDGLHSPGCQLRSLWNGGPAKLNHRCPAGS